MKIHRQHHSKSDVLYEREWNVPPGKTLLNVLLLTIQLATIKIQPHTLQNFNHYHCLTSVYSVECKNYYPVCLMK